MIFQVSDYRNIQVVLTKITWYKKILNPTFGHPEVKALLSRVKVTIKNPDFVYKSIRDPRSKLFFAKINSGIFASYYLVVVVKYLQEEHITVGYISTIMINRKLPKASKLLWEKKVST